MGTLYAALQRFVAANSRSFEACALRLERVVPTLLRLVFRLHAVRVMFGDGVAQPRTWHEILCTATRADACGAAEVDPLAAEQEWWAERPVCDESARALAEAVWSVAAPRSLREAAHALGLGYEALLDLRLVREAAGVWTLSPLRHRRKTAGVFYTPEALAVPTVRRTLAPLCKSLADGVPVRIVDPACGSGPFLLAALEELARHVGEDDAWRALAPACLYGVDLDPVALELARLALWLRLGEREIAPSTFAATLKHGNALVGCWHTDSDALPDQASADAACARITHGDESQGDAALGPYLHWPLAFPEVFAAGGFDAVVGNPPWETLQRERAEFLQAHRAESHVSKEATWQHYRRTVEGHRRWLREATAWHPFRHQGPGKIYTYKLFTELALHLLRPGGGRLGLLVPSGLYTDHGSAALRTWLMETTRWEWLYAFENRRGIFPGIDNRYKFAAIIAERLSLQPASQREREQEQPLRAAFMVQDITAWQSEQEPPALAFEPEWIARFSPRSRSIPEMRHERDLAICKRLYAKPLRLGDVLRYSQGINLTTFYRNGCFREREHFESEGYVADEHGRWIREEDVALPLWQGAMLDHYDPLYQGYEGRSERWEVQPPANKRVAPKYLMRLCDWRERWGEVPTNRLLFRNTGSPTNERSLLVAYAPPFPNGNSAQSLVLGEGSDLVGTLQVAAVLSSFVCDWALRQRMGSPNLNWYLVRELPLPRSLLKDIVPRLVRNTACMSWLHPLFEPQWRELRAKKALDTAGALEPVYDATQRLRLIIENEALVATMYRIPRTQYAWMLRDSAHAPDLRGFHRVRHGEDLVGLALPALAVRAYESLLAGAWSAESAAQLDDAAFFAHLDLPCVSQ